MNMGVAIYSFDILRLMLEYILGKDFFVKSFDSYSNILAVKTLIAQYCYHKTKEKPTQFQKLGLVKEFSD